MLEEKSRVGRGGRSGKTALKMISWWLEGGKRVATRAKLSVLDLKLFRVSGLLALDMGVGAEEC